MACYGIVFEGVHIPSYTVFLFPSGHYEMHQCALEGTMNSSHGKLKIQNSQLLREDRNCFQHHSSKCHETSHEI